MKSRYLTNRILNCDSKYQKGEKLKEQLFWAHWQFFWKQSNPKLSGKIIFLFSSANNSEKGHRIKKDIKMVDEGLCEFGLEFTKFKIKKLQIWG